MAASVALIERHLTTMIKTEGQKRKKKKKKTETNIKPANLPKPPSTD